MIKIKRVYEPAAPDDGDRYLVERLWPRGIRKEKLKMTAWLKEVAPSPELRRWYAHDLAKWAEFQRRYRAQLRAQSPAWQDLLRLTRRGTVTLLYSAHDTEHNSAIVLKIFLEKKLQSKK
ncbi:MAG TPA: DUF488 domain-containing protein [Anaerolineae bacterium]|nr:DUF488 domain-containing protein [Anaerolineae bacterium]